MASQAELRRRLRRLLEEHERLLEVAFRRAPLWRGHVHEIHRRCGKPTCRCVRGDLHISTVFTDRSGATQRNLSLHGKVLERFRRMTEAYRRVRRHRARVVAVQREILAIFDALEAARRQEGVQRYAGELLPRS